MYLIEYIWVLLLLMGKVMGLIEHDFYAQMEGKTDDYENRVALGIRSAFGWKEFTYKGIGLLSRKLARFIKHIL